ncbi:MULTISPECIES: hypothetical protein [Rhodanobacter]|nr:MULTISPECIES: hypothetical protein [Rhodanobacter]
MGWQAGRVKLAGECAMPTAFAAEEPDSVFESILDDVNDRSVS